MKLTVPGLANASLVVAYGDGPGSAQTDPWTVADLVGIDASPQVVLGWMPEAPDWVDRPGLRGVAIMGGYGLSGAIAAGRLRYLPIRLGQVPKLLAETIRPTVAVVSAVRRGDRFAYRSTVGWGPAAVAAASIVIVELDETAADLGTPLIDGPIDHVVPRPVSAPVPSTPRNLAAEDRTIGELVAGLLPGEPALQIGPGGIGEAIVKNLAGPVSVHSGLITESMAELADRELLLGSAHAGYTWGGDAIVRLASAGRLQLHPVETTHDITALASLPRFVACNTALQVGLNGAVNVERVGDRLVAGIGGHADFCAGASRSAGGLSVIACRSTTRSGASTIVANVEVVSTPRCDVDVVVTEHGVADLRGLDDGERRVRLIAIADPAHRGGFDQVP